jgi:glycine cleavage system transcriptional repressor
MSKHLIITLTGPDRIGFVESVTKLIVAHDANVEKSRMARLGGEFAMLMLVTVAENNMGSMRETVTKLQDDGYQVTTRETAPEDSSKYAGWLPYEIEVNGADNEGIIHNITRYLADRGIDIETLNTGTVHAPMSGTPLFTMNAIVLVPKKLSLIELRAELETLGDKLNVDTEVTPYTG